MGLSSTTMAGSMAGGKHQHWGGKEEDKAGYMDQLNKGKGNGKGQGKGKGHGTTHSMEFVLYVECTAIRQHIVQHWEKASKEFATAVG